MAFSSHFSLQLIFKNLQRKKNEIENTILEADIVVLAADSDFPQKNTLPTGIEGTLFVCLF